MNAEQRQILHRQFDVTSPRQDEYPIAIFVGDAANISPHSHTLWRRLQVAGQLDRAALLLDDAADPIPYLNHLTVHSLALSYRRQPIAGDKATFNKFFCNRH